MARNASLLHYISVSLLRMLPPRPAKIPVTRSLHGVTWTDDYAWLRERENPQVLAHLESENAYTEQQMSGTHSLEAKLYEELLGRIQQTDVSVPVRDGNFYYYSCSVEGKQYPLYCRRSVAVEAPEEIYLDANELAHDQDYFRIGVLEVSPNHQLLAYSTDTEGDEDYIVQVKDLATGEFLPDHIPRTYYSLAWAADNRTFFYQVLDDARRPYRIFRHQLGQPHETDTLVFEELDGRFNVEIYPTRSGRFLVIESSSSTSSELHILESDNPEDQFRVIRPRQPDIEYGLSHQGHEFFLRINDRGRNFRLVATPIDNFAEANWQEVIPHRPDVFLEAVAAFEHYLVVTERQGGLPYYRFRPTGQDWRRIEFGEAAYSTHLTGNREYAAKSLRYQFHSPVTPPSVYDFHFETGEKELRKRVEVLGGYDPSHYTVERREAISHDGVAVPIILLYSNKLDRTRPNPALLYGYGSYGANTDAGFSSTRFSLVDRGIVYAIAQVRGGSEMGQPWHDDGKLLKKRNSFLDFAAAARHLIDQGWTTPPQLILEGGSAGGLLVGASVVENPSLYGGVLAHVPFVDVVNTMLDPTLPLTIGEYEEWGNPEHAEAFHYIRSYSPYDNVRPAVYPPMLVTAGLSDPRVPYWEPAKWVARLREMNQGNSEILLKVNMGSGHFGASGRYDRLKEIAF